MVFLFLSHVITIGMYTRRSETTRPECFDEEDLKFGRNEQVATVSTIVRALCEMFHGI